MTTHEPTGPPPTEDELFNAASITRARRELAARVKAAEDAVAAAGDCGDELDALYDVEWTESSRPIPTLLRQAQAALAGAGALARELEAQG
jgi:hypothetical protein